jgi:hypothetical protein
MGYSLSTPCKSPQARDKMAAFLGEHLRPFSEVLRESPELVELQELTRVPLDKLRYDPTKYLCVGDELAYGSGPSKIGFNFSSSSFPFGLWMHALCAWMALRVGRRRGLNALSDVGRADQRVAYTTYDHDPTPVLTKADIADWPESHREHARWRWLVSGLGTKEVEPAEHQVKRWGGEHAEVLDFHRRSEKRDRLLTAIIERELRRLAELWEVESATPA